MVCSQSSFIFSWLFQTLQGSDSPGLERHSVCGAYLCVFVHVCVRVCVFLCESVLACVCVWGVSLRAHVCHMFLCVCVCVCMCESIRACVRACWRQGLARETAEIIPQASAAVTNQAGTGMLKTERGDVISMETDQAGRGGLGQKWARRDGVSILFFFLREPKHVFKLSKTHLMV